MDEIEATFEQLISEALSSPFSGWDFGFLRGRAEDSPLRWKYQDVVRRYLPGVTSLLDMGTGGGEILAGLAPLPTKTVATEQYVPNVEVARKRLRPLGVRVDRIPLDEKPPFNSHLPYTDNEFELVINRHEGYDAREVYRILSPGSLFITQQVGSLSVITLAQFFTQKSVNAGNWNLESAEKELEAAGFVVEYSDEQQATMAMYDVGAVVYYMRAIPWLVEDFSVERYREELLRMHKRIQRTGRFETSQHRFILCARKPVA